MSVAKALIFWLYLLFSATHTHTHTHIHTHTQKKIMCGCFICFDFSKHSMFTSHFYYRSKHVTSGIMDDLKIGFSLTRTITLGDILPKFCSLRKRKGWIWLWRENDIEYRYQEKKGKKNNWSCPISFVGLVILPIWGWTMCSGSHSIVGVWNIWLKLEKGVSPVGVKEEPLKVVMVGREVYLKQTYIVKVKGLWVESMIWLEILLKPLFQLQILYFK